MKKLRVDRFVILKNRVVHDKKLEKLSQRLRLENFGPGSQFYKNLLKDNLDMTDLLQDGLDR